MVEATEHLRGLAREIVAAAAARIPLRAALLAGSAGRGEADFYSDLDLLLYVDELPPKELLGEVRDAVGGASAVSKGETDYALGEEFDVAGVRTEVTFFTVRYAERRLGELLDGLEAVDSPLQKILIGMLEGLPLDGHELVERWQTRLRAYPEPLRRAMIVRHWRFVPLWYHADAMSARDAELWRLDALLDAAFDLLAVLAALNRLYFARFQFKGLRAFVGRMQLAPADLADRLESLFRLEADAAAAELGKLVEETRALVAAELPDLELPLEHPPGTRQEPWRPPATPPSAL